MGVAVGYEVEVGSCEVTTGVVVGKVSTMGVLVEAASPALVGAAVLLVGKVTCLVAEIVGNKT